MATQRQIEANRRNAAGPHQMSEKGKDVVRANAIRRYQTAAERSYYRAIREIARLQKARKQEAAKEIRSVPQNHVAESTAVATPPAPAKPIRSVQKNPREYTHRDMELVNASMSNA